MNPYRLYSADKKPHVLETMSISDGSAIELEAAYELARLQTIMDIATAVKSLAPTTVEDYQSILQAFVREVAQKAADLIIDFEFTEITKDMK